MSIVNIQRDGFWLTLDTASDLTWGGNESITVTNPQFNNSGIVNTDVGKAFVKQAKTAAAEEYFAIGVLMAQTPGDNTPFRIKADVAGPDGGGAIIVGYADASPTGTNDHINEPQWLAFVDTFDDVVIVPDNPTYADRALCVALAATSSPTATTVIGSLSVQALAIKPPTMQNAVS